MYVFINQGGRLAVVSCNAHILLFLFLLLTCARMRLARYDTITESCTLSLNMCSNSALLKRGTTAMVSAKNRPMATSPARRPSCLCVCIVPECVVPYDRAVPASLLVVVQELQIDIRSECCHSMCSESASNNIPSHIHSPQHH